MNKGVFPLLLIFLLLSTSVFSATGEIASSFTSGSTDVLNLGDVANNIYWGTNTSFGSEQCINKVAFSIRSQGTAGGTSNGVQYLVWEMEGYVNGTAPIAAGINYTAHSAIAGTLSYINQTLNQTVCFSPGDDVVIGGRINGTADGSYYFVLEYGFSAPVAITQNRGANITGNTVGWANDWAGLTDIGIRYYTYNTTHDYHEVSFVPPTPENGVLSNTQEIINMTSTNNQVTLWFSNTPTLTDAHKIFNNFTVTEGYLNWTTAIVADGVYYYKAAADSTFNSSISNLVYDTTSPSIVINNGNGFTENNGTVSNPYLEILTLNITINDTNQVSGFVINITNTDGEVQYSYTNNTLSGTTFNFTKMVNISEWTDNNLYTIQITASDEQSGKRSYNWYKGQKSYNAPVVLSETNFVLFLNLTHTHGIRNVFSGLTYEGSDVEVSRDNHTTHTYFNATISPQGIGSNEISWNISYEVIGDGLNNSFHINDTHVVNIFLLSSCIEGNLTRNFNIFDENNPSTYLNGTLEIDGTYWAEGTANKTLNVSYSSTPANLCITPGTGELYGDLYVKYTVPTGFTHRWYVVNETFTTNTEYVEMGNYNLTTDISDLSITVRRIDNFRFFPNVIAKLQRKYPSEGVWRTVQMDESGDYGLLFFNIREEDTDYRIIFMDRQNHILKTTASVKFVCRDGFCEIIQQLDPYDESTASSDPIIAHSFNNESRVLTVSWVVTNGDSITLSSTVTKETLTGTTEICGSSASGSSGTITCNTTGYDGTFLVLVSQSGTPEYSALQEAPANKLSELLENVESAFWAVGILVTIIMFGAILGPSAVAIATVFGILAVYFLGIFSPITLSFVAVVAVLAFVVALKVKT